MIEIILFFATGLVYFILFIVIVFLILIGLGYLGSLLVPRNENNQKALDRATDELLHTKIENLLKSPRNKQATVKINNEIIKYSYGKDEINDKLIHIVLQTTQKTKFGFYYNFLNGVKIIDKKEVLLLTGEELGDYD